MKCNYVLEKLSAFIDNELDSEISEIIKTHLENCDICRQTFEKYKLNDEKIIKSLKNQEIPDEFSDNIMRQITTNDYPFKAPADLSANLFSNIDIASAAVIAIFLTSFISFAYLKYGDFFGLRHENKLFASIASVEFNTLKRNALFISDGAMADEK